MKIIHIITLLAACFIFGLLIYYKSQYAPTQMCVDAFKIYSNNCNIGNKNQIQQCKKLCLTCRSSSDQSILEGGSWV